MGGEATPSGGPAARIAASYLVSDYKIMGYIRPNLPDWKSVNA